MGVRLKSWVVSIAAGRGCCLADVPCRSLGSGCCVGLALHQEIRDLKGWSVPQDGWEPTDLILPWGAWVPPHHWGSHVPQGWWLVSAMELFAQVVLKGRRSISPSPASQERLITSQGAERSPSLNTSGGRCRQGILMGQNKREREGRAHAMPRPIFIWRAGARRCTPACMLDPSPGSHVCRDYIGISREQSTRNQEGIKPAGSTGNRKAPQHPQDMHDKQEMEQRSSLMLCGGREQEGGHSQTPP